MRTAIFLGLLIIAFAIEDTTDKPEPSPRLLQYLAVLLLFFVVADIIDLIRG